MVSQIKNNSMFANRGMQLEKDLEQTNQYYIDNDIAIIYKKPTPITIKKVEYPNQKYTKIIDGYFSKKSTTDYNGIYNGKYIDFEAKETKNSSLMLSAIHQHQINHLKKVKDHGGIAFVIITFSQKNETYLIEIEPLIKLDKKSLTVDDMKNKGYLIPLTFQPRLDYLKIIKKIYF